MYSLEKKCEAQKGSQKGKKGVLLQVDGSKNQTSFEKKCGSIHLRMKGNGSQICNSKRNSTNGQSLERRNPERGGVRHGQRNSSQQIG